MSDNASFCDYRIIRIRHSSTAMQERRDVAARIIRAPAIALSTDRQLKQAGFRRTSKTTSASCSCSFGEFP
jgi:hypothetical protein